jgi:hypothetical protein
VNCTRREFARGLTLAGTAGALGMRPTVGAAEPPPETTIIKLLSAMSRRGLRARVHVPRSIADTSRVTDKAGPLAGARTGTHERKGSPRRNRKLPVTFITSARRTTLRGDGRRPPRASELGPAQRRA